MMAAEIILLIAAMYVVTGCVCAALFMVWGLGVVDSSARGAPMLFKVFVFPGLVAFWPLMLRKLRVAKQSAASKSGDRPLEQHG